MKICAKRNRYLLISGVLIIILPLRVLGQGDSLSLILKSQSTDSVIARPKHSLYVTAGAGSNMIYLGSSISQNKPLYSTAMSYGYRNIYVTASAVHLEGLNPFVAFSSLSFNYSHTFNSWFDIVVDISGFKTTKSLQETLFSDFGFINLTTGFDWKLLYTKVSVGGLISSDKRGYLQIRNSRYFETPELFKGKGLISFDPNINILFGEMVKIETVNGIKKYGASPPFRHLKNNPNNTNETYSYKFGLVDFEFSLPVTFTCGRFSIEAEPEYILPAFSNPEYPASKGFSFSLYLFIRIF